MKVVIAPNKKPTAKPRPRYKSFLILLVGVLLIAYGASGLWQHYHATHTPQPTIPKKVVALSTQAPNETKPPCSTYTVPASLPLRIILPSINASGCIERVGNDKTGAVGVPDNVYLAAWYTKSVLPGNSGVSLIDGHVQGYYAPGIFKHLANLKAGDQFEVEFGDYSQRVFQVVSVQSYSVNDVASKMLEQDPDIAQQLNLITCGGPYDRNAKEYTQRILVVSKRIT